MFQFRRFTPDYCLPSIFEIPLPELRQRGVKALIFDLDNTLTDHDNPEFPPATLSWLAHLAACDLRACLLSNNRGQRVDQAARKLGIPFVANACKPRRSGFLRAFNLLEVKPAQAAVVGDQIFTDIWGGNQAGAITILVNPVSGHELWGTRHISRRAERLVWRFVRKNMAETANCREKRRKSL